MKFITTLFLILYIGFPQQVLAAESSDKDAIQIKNPGAELWRNVRQRDIAVEGASQIGENTLIHVSGQDWREYRMELLIPSAGIVIITTLLAILLFRIIRGKILVKAGRSGKKILRFTLSQRIAHWSATVLFLLLAVTGLMMLFGRLILIPIIGVEPFSIVLGAGKMLHDYLGPLFAVALLYMFIQFVHGNIISFKVDIMWVLKLGGYFGKHANAGRYNAGEKMWFWVAMLGGISAIVSGLVLDFPIFGQTRSTMEFYHVIHSLAAIVIIIGSFGHIYLAYFGVDGALEIMQTGYCDSNWAREHHDLWYEEKKAAGEIIDDRSGFQSGSG